MRCYSSVLSSFLKPSGARLAPSWIAPRWKLQLGLVLMAITIQSPYVTLINSSSHEPVVLLHGLEWPDWDYGKCPRFCPTTVFKQAVFVWWCLWNAVLCCAVAESSNNPNLIGVTSVILRHIWDTWKAGTFHSRQSKSESLQSKCAVNLGEVIHAFNFSPQNYIVWDVPHLQLVFLSLSTDGLME